MCIEQEKKFIEITPPRYDDVFHEAMQSFYERLEQEMKPMPQEFITVVDDNFWELI